LPRRRFTVKHLKELRINAGQVRPALELFIRGEVEGAGLKSVIPGISGGAGSATAAGLAATDARLGQGV
jgi:NH3-dependent NAD+ synthetase